ncbi:MAG: mandelate racemase/muconate lactonizing enzyme family protein, partial [bacterium]
MRIQTVRAATLRIPLETPVIVGGGLRIAEREYLLVAIDTDNGLRGVGWSFTRDADLAGVANRLQSLLDGEDPLATERLWERMAAQDSGPTRGTIMRALSAIDIALWDIKGQVAGLPLHRLLGGYRTEVPVLMAGMYYTPGRSLADDVREATLMSEQGFRTIKMMGGAVPFAEDLERVRAVRQALGPDIGIALDVNGAWTDHTVAAAHARVLADLNVAFIEEPLPAEDRAGLAALVAESAVPIAAGETLYERGAFRELVAGGAILRPDATVVGGISEWMKVHALGVTWGLRVIPHYFPEVHIHLAAAFAGVEAVECVTTVGDISNFHRI